MGDSHHTLLRPSFNGSLAIEGRSDRLTPLAGTVVLRELDERLGVTAAMASKLVDPRDPSRVQHSMTELLRTLTYTMAAERTAQSAAERLRDDPAMRLAAADGRGLSPLASGGELASQPTFSRLLSSFTTDVNLAVLKDSIFDSAARAVRAMNGGKKLGPVTLDIDSFPHEVFGAQPGSKWNGHYKERCYHPLGVMLGETGHWLGLELRPGNVHTANGDAAMLLPLIDRVEAEVASVADVRGDAGFVGPRLLEALEVRGVRYAFRLPTNKLLAQMAEPHIYRPPGRPPKEPRTWTTELRYRAETWPEKRRVVLVVCERPGELYLDSFFIVTSFTQRELSADEVVDYYRARGTMEGHIGEHQSVVSGRLSSTNRPKSNIKNSPIGKRSQPVDAERVNAASLALHGIAFNLLNTLRLLGGSSGKVNEPARLHLSRARRELLAVAGRVVVSARRATLVVTAKTAALWGRLWKALRRLEPVAEAL
jgi:hypothetical protein